MKRRGLIIFLASIPLWIIGELWYYEAIKRLDPLFRYEFGSAGAPFPPLIRAIGWFAFLMSLTGICLSAFDFTSWVKKRVWKR